MNSSTPSCPVDGDNDFGPLVAECVRTLDFTLVFEETIMSIGPLAVFLILAPFRLVQLYQRKRRVAGHMYQKIKLGAIVFYGLIQIALLALWAINSELRTSSALASAAVATISVAFIGILSWSEHAKSIRPSLLINAYFLFSFMFDLMRARTLFIGGWDTKISAFFTVSVVMKAVILALESREKRQWLTEEQKDLSPEETYGMLNQSLFIWLNPLILSGSKKVLNLKDLYALPHKLETANLNDRFKCAWEQSQSGGKHRLLGVLLKVLKWELLAPVPGRIGIIIFTFCQPLLLERFTTYLQEPEGSRTQSIGVGLIGAYGIVYLSLAISNGFYWHQVFRGITMIRGILVSSIFRKTMLINVTALDNSQAVTLMSTDVQRIVDGLKLVHEIWANVFQIIIAVYLLELQLGVACVAPLAVAIACLFVIAFIGNIAGPRQALWMAELEKRVGITATMLSSMKGVKMTGLSSRLAKNIQQLRVNEIKAGTKFRMILVYAISLAFAPQLLSPIFAFAIFSIQAYRTGITLDATRMFTSTALMILLATPLTQTIQNIPELMGAVACIGRIQEFLESKPRVDQRKLPGKPSVTVPFPTVEMPSKTKKWYSIRNASADPTTGEESTEKLTSISTGTNSPQIEKVPQAIMVQDGAFGWQDEEDVVLENITMTLPPGQLTFIVGPVACGKSTLLKALLGETPYVKGIVEMPSDSIAFCDQTPWLINASIQRNIIGYSVLDPEYYKTVIQACVLDGDLATFPDGDQTLVGSNGITLSGGQKQRIAVARAVYARKEIAIFDDIFSGLDASTMQSLFNRVFAPGGLLSQNGTTVIIATHAVNFLTAGHHIVALTKDGWILEQGSFAELNAQEGYVQSLHLTSRTFLESTEEEKKYSSALVPVNKIADDMSRQSGDFSLYSYYLRTMGIYSLIIFFLGEAGFAVFSTFPTIWLEWWSDDNITEPNVNYGHYLGGYAGLQGAAMALITIIAYHMCQNMIVKSGTKLHETLLKTVLAAPMSFFAQIDIGITTNRFSQDIQLIDSELPVSMLDFIAGLLIVISQAVLIANASYYIAISYPVLLAVFVFVQKLYLRTSRQLRLMDLEMKSPLYSLFLESLKGLSTVRAFGWERSSEAQNDSLLDDSQRPFYLLFMVQRWLTLVLDLIAVALAVIVVTVAVELRHTTSPGFTGVALVNIISFTDFLKHLIVVWTNLETALGAVSRIKTFSIETESEHRPGEDGHPPFHWPRKGGIEFRNLSASYDGSKDNLALNNIHLSVRDGEKIAICGHSGSGKSSMVMALFRMLELQTGSILVDGIDISTLPREDVRTLLNGIPQDPYFLSGTLRTNVDPYENCSDPLIVEALRKVELWTKLEAAGGLDAEFDVDSLSHGERQLLCLARAILRRSKIVVLDEATSSVDRQTDRLMQRVIRQEFKHSTIIAIVHRLETVRDFDRIVVLDHGKIIECDRPDVLLARDSAYRNMYEMYESSRLNELAVVAAVPAVPVAPSGYPLDKKKSGGSDPTYQDTVPVPEILQGFENAMGSGQSSSRLAIPRHSSSKRRSVQSSFREQNRRPRRAYSIRSIETSRSSISEQYDIIRMQMNSSSMNPGHFLGGGVASSVSDITLAMTGMLSERDNVNHFRRYD